MRDSGRVVQEYNGKAAYGWMEEPPMVGGTFRK